MKFSFHVVEAATSGGDPGAGAGPSTRPVASSNQQPPVGASSSSSAASSNNNAATNQAPAAQPPAVAGQQMVPYGSQVAQIDSNLLARGMEVSQAISAQGVDLSRDIAGNVRDMAFGSPTRGHSAGVVPNNATNLVPTMPGAAPLAAAPALVASNGVPGQPAAPARFRDYHAVGFTMYKSMTKEVVEHNDAWFCLMPVKATIPGHPEPLDGVLISRSRVHPGEWEISLPHYPSPGRNGQIVTFEERFITPHPNPDFGKVGPYLRQINSVTDEWLRN